MAGGTLGFSDGVGAAARFNQPCGVCIETNGSIIVTTPEITAIRDADRVAGLLEANGIYDVKLVVNRVRADMIKKNDMMSVKDVQEMLGVPVFDRFMVVLQVTLIWMLALPLQDR